MDFSLTQEQQMLKRAARELMEKEIIPAAAEQERRGPASKEEVRRILKKLVPLGFLCGPLDEEHGGQGLNWLNWGLLLEELGRGWAAMANTAIIQFNFAHQIAHLGTAEQKRKYLHPALQADAIVSHSYSEPSSGSNLARLGTTATHTKDGWILNGDKVFISLSPVADWTLALAGIKGGDGKDSRGVFIVDRAKSPFTVAQSTRLGLRGMPSGEVSFVDCKVPLENQLPSAGYKETLIMLTASRLEIAAIAVGISQAATDMSIRYAKQREAFGRPIGSFQLIQGQIADMVAETQAARLLTYEGLDLLDKGVHVGAQASIAKFYATETAARVTTLAVTIHGGYGLQDEYPVERYARDAITELIPDGPPQLQRLIAGRQILGMSAFT